MTRPSVSPEVIAYIVNVVERALTHEADIRAANFGLWVGNRAASIAQSLSMDLAGDCWDCGAVPLREQNEITEPLRFIGTRKDA